MNHDFFSQPQHAPVLCDLPDQIEGGGKPYIALFMLLIYMPIILLIDTSFFFIRPPQLFSLAQTLGLREITDKLIIYRLVLCYTGWLLYWIAGGLLIARFRIPTIRIVVTLMLASYLVNSAAIMFFSRYTIPSFFEHHLSDIFFNAFHQNAIISAVLAMYFYCSKRIKKVYATMP